MPYSRIRGIIFDLGSTLIEYDNRPWPETINEGQKRAYDSLHLETDKVPDFETFNSRLEEIKDHFRIRAQETLAEWRASQAPEMLFRELGLDNPKRRGERFIDIFYTAVREQLTVDEDAATVLKTLKDRGYLLGLISNTIYPRRHHESDLRQFALMEYLSFRIYSSELGRRKPHPDIFRAGLDLMRLPPSEILYIGDRIPEDVEGARLAGMIPILKLWPKREYPDPLPEGLTAIRRLAELPDLLEK
jgi:HAD superfamily hydrolase (TIGR01549 family)